VSTVSTFCKNFLGSTCLVSEEECLLEVALLSPPRPPPPVLLDPPSPFKSSLLPLHLRAATRRAAIAGSTPPPARELISLTDNRLTVENGS